MGIVIKGQYLATPNTAADKDFVPLLVDSAGRLITTIGSVTASLDGQYNSSLPTISDGASNAMQVDVNGRLLSVPYGVYNTSLPTMTNGLKGVMQLAVGGQQIVANMGQYNSAAPTVVDAAWANLQMDVNGNVKIADQFAPQAEDNTNGVYAMIRKPLAVNTYALTSAANLGAAAAATAKASAGTVYKITCHNVNAAVRYLQVHNKATTPANPDVPIFSYPVPLSVGAVNIDFPDGLYCSTGVSWGISTTMATYTAATAGEHNVFIQYK